MPIDSRRARSIKGLIEQIDDMFILNPVRRVWESRMKQLAAKILKPGSDEEIEEMGGGLDALDHIWGLSGDHCIGGDEVYYRWALDYYLGRKVSHVWGEGILVRFIRSDEKENMLPKEQEAFEGGLSVSEEFLDRGFHHGIALKYPCQCGKVDSDMFAIPGVHTGGFAYLIMEGNKNYFDVRNHCMTCNACGPEVKAQLAELDGKLEIKTRKAEETASSDESL